jgi:hypothetical protein
MQGVFDMTRITIERVEAQQILDALESLYPRTCKHEIANLKQALAEQPAPVQLTDDVVQKIISKLEPLLDAKNQSWAEAERMLHGITEKGNT